MKVYYNIQQGTEEWHEIRYGKVGGTLASGLLTKGDNLLHEILAEHSEDFEMDYEGFVSPDVQRGYELEPQARQELQQYTGIEIKQAGWIQSEENDLLGISPDGISEDETECCEIKCPGAKKHTQTILSDAIPLDNIDQCIHYFTVNPKLKKLHFCSFRPENKFKPLFVKTLTPESMVNIGTNAKPVMKSVAEVVLLAKAESSVLKESIKGKIEQLQF
jgi:hypothetical protein